VTSEPFESMLVFVELPLLQRALEEIFGAGAVKARLRDVSAFTDDALDIDRNYIFDFLIRGFRPIGIYTSSGFPESHHRQVVDRSIPAYKTLKNPPESHHRQVVDRSIPTSVFRC